MGDNGSLQNRNGNGDIAGAIIDKRNQEYGSQCGRPRSHHCLKSHRSNIASKVPAPTEVVCGSSRYLAQAMDAARAAINLVFDSCKPERCQ